MIDSLQLFSKYPIELDRTFIRSNNGYNRKLGFNFKLATNGYLNVYGSLSEFWNKINNISETNYPLIPINEIEFALNTFEEIFNIRLNDIDVKRIDFSIDLNYNIFFDLNNLEIINKNYDVKTFSKLESSVMFSQKKNNNIRLLFYQNAAKNRPAGIRFETRYFKNSVPFIYGSQIKIDKIIDHIIPNMELHLGNVIYKNENININIQDKKLNYSEIRNFIYQYGLHIMDNKAFTQILDNLKNAGTDRHILKRITDERNEILLKNSTNLINDPVKLLLNNLKQIKNGF